MIQDEDREDWDETSWMKRSFLIRNGANNSKYHKSIAFVQS